MEPVTAQGAKWNGTKLIVWFPFSLLY